MNHQHDHYNHRRVRRIATVTAIASLSIAACGGGDEADDTAAPPTSVATANAEGTDPASTDASPSVPETAAPAESTSGTEPAEPAEIQDVSFQTFPGLVVGVPIQVAIDHGIFEANGLNVEVSDAAGGPAMVSAVVAGQVDMAGIPNFVGIQSIVAGAEIGVVVGLAGGGGSLLFVGNDIEAPDIEYPESASVLDGAVLAAAAPGGFSDRLYQYLIADAGIEGAEIVTLQGVAEALAAIDAGRIDVANLDLISAYRGEQEGIGHVLYDFQGTGPAQFRGASTNAVWASSAFIEEHPDLVEAFARSIAQANAWLADPANAEATREYFEAVAGAEVSDDLLTKLLLSLKPVVSADDLAAYAQLLDDPSAFDSDAALSPAVPTNDTELAELIGS